MAKPDGPTMTQEEVAQWERAVKEGTLFPRERRTYGPCVCGHSQGTHSHNGTDGAGLWRYTGRCHRRGCYCGGFLAQ